MARPGKFLFCGHPARPEPSPPQQHLNGDDLSDPEEPYDWDDFFSQVVVDPEPAPDFLGVVYVRCDDGEWLAWWMRGDEQHDLAEGARDEVFAAAHQHVASRYLLQTDDTETPIDWVASGYSEPFWDAPAVPVVEADVPGIIRLCEPEADAAEAFRILTRRPHIGLVIRRGGQLLGVALGAGHDDARGSVDLVVVAPEFRRQGMARRLITALEKELSESGCAVAEVRGRLPVRAWPGVDVRFTAAVCAFERLGYRRTNCVTNMEISMVDVCEDEAVGLRFDEWWLGRQGCVIREAAVEDVRALRGNWPDDWVEAAGTALRGDGGCLIALHDDQIVALVVDGVNRPHEIGPLGTAAAFRGRGIGGVLLRRTVAALAGRGHRTAEIVDATALPFLSGQVEARTGRVFWQYEKTLPGVTTE